jgi:ABC-type sugar transport system substrate-binding protein
LTWRKAIRFTGAPRHGGAGPHPIAAIWGSIAGAPPARASHAALTLLLVVACLLPGPDAEADPVVVGASWSNFQEERWKIDEAALRGALEELGAGYASADAQSSSEKQLSDVETLMAKGADVLVIAAQDADAIAPVVQLALAEGIPVVAYEAVPAQALRSLRFHQGLAPGSQLRLRPFRPA